MSLYGSHRSMVVNPLRHMNLFPHLSGGGKVVCEDSRGPYVTEIKRLDTGLADAKRWDR